jgi:hypothetical protein
MSLFAVASEMGVTCADLEALLQGKVTITVAFRLNTTTHDAELFIHGAASIGLAATVGCTASDLQQLRDRLGREGAIGFLVGLGLDRG